MRPRGLGRKLWNVGAMLLSRDIAVITNAIAFNFLLCLFPLLLVVAAATQQLPGGRKALPALVLILQELIPFEHQTLADALQSLGRLARKLEVFSLVLIVWGNVRRLPAGPRLILSVSAFLLAGSATVEPQDGWVKVFNGRDLSGFETWLGVPNKAVTGLDLPRNAEGGYAEPLGTADPKSVYSVVQKDGAPAIRISGEIFGALTGKEEYGDFHLKLQFKWGEKKWPPRENVVRDSGILYYAVGPHGASGNNKAWMRSLECQVQEGDVGDYWGVAGAIVDVEGDRTGEGKDQKTVYRKGAPVVTIDGSPRRAIKSLDHEKAGEWNTVEVLCAKGTCVHVVNGKVNLVLTNPRQPAPRSQGDRAQMETTEFTSGVPKEGGGTEPLLKGKLQIQSEGAEVFYRDIQVRPIREIPKEYRP